MKATIYLPGQPARLLSETELAALNVGQVPSAHTENEEMLTADWEAVSALMNNRDCDLILATPNACAFGLENAADYDCPLNTEAVSHLLRLFDYADLVGPLLIIEGEVTNPQPATETNTVLYS